MEISGTYISFLILVATLLLFYLKNKSSSETFESLEAHEKLMLQKNLNWVHSKPHPSGKYGNFNPVARFPDIIEEFGPPSVLDKEAGGFALWDKTDLEDEGSCFEQIILKDELIPHSVPAPHTDFLYATYKLDIPKEMRCEVLKLSDSLFYDPLKTELIARCHFMGAVVSTLWLAVMMVKEAWTLEEAKNLYGPTINSTIMGSKTYIEGEYEKMLDDLCENYDFGE